MSDTDQHVNAVAKSKWHADGACVSRHDSGRKPGCNYARNGFQVTKASRTADYNAPMRFEASKADAVAQQMRVVGKKHKQVHSPYPQPPDPARTESLWNVGNKADGRNENFKPRGVGFHYPYLHNWHHMIANAMLVNNLVLRDKPEPYVLPRSSWPGSTTSTGRGTSCCCRSSASSARSSTGRFTPAITQSSTCT